MYQIGDRFVVIRDSLGGPKVGDTGTLVGSIGAFIFKLNGTTFAKGTTAEEDVIKMVTDGAFTMIWSIFTYNFLKNAWIKSTFRIWRSCYD